jgi:hypothetical protein
MGYLYVENTNGITVTAKGGSAATSGGAGGNRGGNAAEDPYNQYTASGGGGGGAGGFGGAAANIGTGGPGGGGGGGGAAGNSAGATGSNFYYVGAGGGKGGSNADDSNASDGATSNLTSMQAAELKEDVDEDDEYEGGWESGNGMHDGGNGGGKGSDSSSGSTNPTTTTNIPPAYAPVAITPNSDGSATPTYWSTYYNATQGYTADENTTVYKAALNGTSSVTLTEVAGRELAAGQAVILKSTTGTITLTPAATTSSDFTGNDLKGGTTVTSGNVAYTLSRGNAGTGAVGFYKFSGSLDGSKAHLEISTSAGTRSFIGFGDDNTTGIELPALADDEAAEWYSLDGRRLSGKPARKGIYVKDGQKYIIK